MKCLYVGLILCLQATVLSADTLSYNGGIGISFTRFSTDEINSQNQMINVSLRYYETNNIFYSTTITSWNAGSNNTFSKSGTIITGNIGYRTSGRFFFETSLGVGYLNNPDGKIINDGTQEIETGYTTGHRQFELNFGCGYKVNSETAILIGWAHFSNCKTICKLDSSYAPNGGRDFFRFNIEKKF